MNNRKNISTWAKWEPIVGFSRAVRIGNQIFVSGTVAVDGENKVIAPNNYYEQTKFIIQKIEKVIKEAGGSLSDVVRTRIYVLDINQWEDVACAHKEFFGTICPATSMIEIKGLVGKELVVEIEADAVL